ELSPANSSTPPVEVRLLPVPADGLRVQSIARSSRPARPPQYQLWVGRVLIEIKKLLRQLSVNGGVRSRARRSAPPLRPLAWPIQCLAPRVIVEITQQSRAAHVPRSPVRHLGAVGGGEPIAQRNDPADCIEGSQWVPTNDVEIQRR